MSRSRPPFVIKVLIRGYQWMFGWWTAGHCRFSPTCSEYALECYAQFGWVTATRKTLGRLLRCHPFCDGGWDPVRKSS